MFQLPGTILYSSQKKKKGLTAWQWLNVFKNSHWYRLNCHLQHPFYLNPWEDIWLSFSLSISGTCLKSFTFVAGCWQGLCGQQGGGGPHCPRSVAGELSIVVLSSHLMCPHCRWPASCPPRSCPPWPGPRTESRWLSASRPASPSRARSLSGQWWQNNPC